MTRVRGRPCSVELHRAQRRLVVKRITETRFRQLVGLSDVHYLLTTASGQGRRRDTLLVIFAERCRNNFFGRIDTSENTRSAGGGALDASAVVPTIVDTIPALRMGSSYEAVRGRSDRSGLDHPYRVKAHFVERWKALQYSIVEMDLSDVCI